LQRIEAVVNPAAGSVGAGAGDLVRGLLANHGFRINVRCPEPGKIEAALRAAFDAGPDLVIVLAGDGTARRAAELAGPNGPLVAPLPGGTMNLLPRALYGDRPWMDALAHILEHGVARPVSGGRVGGRVFFVGAVLGPAALLGRAREAIRLRDLGEALRRARHALRSTFAGELHYRLDGGPERRTEALALITPMISRAMDEEAALEAASFDVHDAGEVVRLAIGGLFGAWRSDPSVAVAPCRAGVARSRRHTPAILDGEVFRLPRRTSFGFEPLLFKALAPPDPLDKTGGI